MAGPARVPEAGMEQTPEGARPRGEGWYVLNVADARAFAEPGAQYHVGFEGDVRFRDYGMNVQVLYPGRPNAAYHSENVQESVLVVSGECTLVVEGEQRPLKAWDFVHLPAGTHHALVGAGVGPCVVVMAGARCDDRRLHYPVDEVAASFGASSLQETTDPAVAYAGWTPPQPMSMPWPPQ